MTPEEAAYLIRALTEAPKWQEHSKQERERQVAHHVRAAVEAAIEDCAKVCEERIGLVDDAESLAAAIRARKERHD